jgi:hypothetical protein
LHASFGDTTAGENQYRRHSVNNWQENFGDNNA